MDEISSSIDPQAFARAVDSRTPEDGGQEAGRTPEQMQPGLIGHIKNIYQQAVHNRLFDEQRWLRAYRNYRGLYGNDQVWRETERSRVFVKITKTKVLAAYNAIMEATLNSGRFPISVEPTRLPEGVAEFVHLDQTQKSGQAKEEEKPAGPQYGFPGDGKDLPPGATAESLFGGNGEKYGEDKLPWKEGPSPALGKIPQLEPAKIAAKYMQKTIDDQIDAGDVQEAFKKSIFEMCLLGTGVLKGPYTAYKKKHKWTRDGEQTSYTSDWDKFPTMEHVSLWDVYPTGTSKELEQTGGLIHMHAMTASQLRSLRNRDGFVKEAIESILETHGPNYTPRWFEHVLDDRQTQGLYSDKYEVLEWWGILDKSQLEDWGLTSGQIKGLNMETVLDEVAVNVWVCGTEVIRAVVNPFMPSRIPYMLCYYEENPYQIFGIGVAENMEDSQQIMNGHVRMAIDNLALAGNVILEIDRTNLVDGQTFDLYPGKQFEREGGTSGTAGKAIHSITINDVSQSNMHMFDRFRQLSDEQTGLPSQMHGQSGHQTGVRSAAQTSMMMNAGTSSIKGVVKNIDCMFLQPMAEGYFHWNMQFNADEKIQGDLEIRARGTTALMQKEVKSQRLLAMMQLAGSSQALLPILNWRQALSDYAETIDVDPDRMVADPDQMKIMAMMIGQMQNANAKPEDQVGGPTSQAPETGPSGPRKPGGDGVPESGGGATGPAPAEGGSIGPGNGVPPGGPGFSG